MMARSVPRPLTDFDTPRKPPYNDRLQIGEPDRLQTVAVEHVFPVRDKEF